MTPNPCRAVQVQSSTTLNSNPCKHTAHALAARPLKGISGMSVALTVPCGVACREHNRNRSRSSARKTLKQQKERNGSIQRRRKKLELKYKQQRGILFSMLQSPTWLLGCSWGSPPALQVGLLPLCAKLCFCKALHFPRLALPTPVMYDPAAAVCSATPRPAEVVLRCLFSILISNKQPGFGCRPMPCLICALSPLPTTRSCIRTIFKPA